MTKGGAFRREEPKIFSVVHGFLQSLSCTRIGYEAFRITSAVLTVSAVMTVEEWKMQIEAVHKCTEQNSITREL